MHLVNERDYLATRVAYKLNLKGPAISVSTGCSTSLVAVCQAVESIRSGQCDAAIAGGVYVPAPHRAGYLFQEGGFGSSDGLCRPFDKNASGTVFSSGTGAVVLRRLDQALQNKDRIYAVIRGVGRKLSPQLASIWCIWSMSATISPLASHTNSISRARPSA